MSKFILIDPSIQDYQGHYFEYAQRVLTAARGAGYEPIAAANRSFKDVQEGEIRVRPVYKFGFWYTRKDDGWRRRLLAPLRGFRRKLFAAKLALRYSKLGLMWSLRLQWREALMKRSWEPATDWYLFLPFLLVYFLHVARSAGALLASVVPFRKQVASLGALLGSYCRRVLGAVASLLTTCAHPFALAVKPQRQVTEWIWTRWRLRQFLRDTRQLLTIEPVGVADISVISTTSIVELVGLAHLFQRYPKLAGGTWHLVFRHNLHAADENQDYSEATRTLRNALHYFRQRVPADRVFLYTDTEELSAQYNALGILPFHTLPVPVAQEYFRERNAHRPAAPLNVTYIGDAREEKGYPLLPGLVADLWASHLETGRARFTVQSNFSTPEGTPETVVARSLLAGWPEEQVKLIHEPMSPAAYREQVLAADVILVPYNARGYYARSSGIFAEALAAGIPVLAPAGTWMSIQLTRPHYEHHLSLLKRASLVETRRLPDAAWKITGAPNSRPMTKGALRLSSWDYRVCKVAAPRDANSLLIRFREETSRRGQFVELQITQCGSAGRIVATETRVLGGCSCGVSAFLRLKRATRSVQISVRNAYSLVPIELRDVRFDFLDADADVASEAVGVILHEPGKLADATRELLKHHAHYRESALRYSETWARYHSPERLVADLQRTVADGASPPSARRMMPAPHFLSTSLPQFHQEADAHE